MDSSKFCNVSDVSILYHSSILINCIDLIIPAIVLAWYVNTNFFPTDCGTKLCTEAWVCWGLVRFLSLSVLCFLGVISAALSPIGFGLLFSSLSWIGSVFFEAVGFLFFEVEETFCSKSALSSGVMFVHAVLCLFVAMCVLIRELRVVFPFFNSLEPQGQHQ